MKKLILGISFLALTTGAYCDGAQIKPREQKVVKEVVKLNESTPLALKISGMTSVNHYVHDMRCRNENEGKGRGTHLAVEDSRINFEVTGNYSQHEIGYLIGIAGNAEHGKNPIEENRIKIKGNWGTILAGDTRSASDFMVADTTHFSGGTGGVLGNYKGVINEPTGVILSTDLLHKMSPKDQTKIIYVTPNAYGFQASYTYIPDGSHKGEQPLMSHSPKSHGMAAVDGNKFAGQNLHEFVLKYQTKDFYGIQVDWSGAFIVGKIRNHQNVYALLNQVKRQKMGLTTKESIERRDLSAYSTGIVFHYKGFSLGSELLNNRKSGQLKILEGANYGKVWTIGAGYRDDMNKYSVVYFNSKRNLGKYQDFHFGHAKSNNFALTYDRLIVPGLTMYAEGLFLNLKNSNRKNLKHWHTTFNGFDGDVTRSNKGKVLTTGARINF